MRAVLTVGDERTELLPLGAIFRTFFPRKNDFSKLFPRKIEFFPNIFGGKFSAEFSAELSQEKMYEKSAPG
jgi:hypothetical protein